MTERPPTNVSALPDLLRAAQEATDPELRHYALICLRETATSLELQNEITKNEEGRNKDRHVSWQADADVGRVLRIVGFIASLGIAFSDLDALFRGGAGFSAVTLAVLSPELRRLLPRKRDKAEG